MTRQPLRVLLVEHDTADAELCVHELTRAGFDVASRLARTRDEFVAYLHAEPFDIVLADFHLPSWTGMDALATLRREGFDIPLVLVTGTLGEDRAVDSVKQGAADYVIKQNLARLPMTVRRALAERQTRLDRMKSEELIHNLTLAVDQSPASVVITDLDATIQYVNQRFTEISGYSAAEAIGNSPRILSSGLTDRAVYRDMWRALRAGKVWRGEIINRRKTGETYWDAVSITPVRNDTGTVSHYLAIQQDVTDRRLTEQVLREREERFRQLAENINEVFFISDVNFRETLYISPAYETIWGRTRADAYENPRSFLDAVHPEDRDALMHAIARAQQGEDPGSLEFRVVRPDGDIRWVTSHAVPIRDETGKVYRISGVASDITERRRAEHASAETAARMRAITEASFDGIVFSVGGIIHDVNRGFAEMLGYSVDELTGMPAVSLVAAEELAAASDRLSKDTEGTFEIALLHRGGQRLRFDATVKTYEFGGRRGRIAALRNVTEQRLLEAQLRQAQKMEAVGRLAGGVAHDFNNLLTVIMSYAEFLLPSFPATDARRDDLEQVVQAAHAAAGLTRQLLAFTRQQVIQPRLVILEEVVSHSKRILQRLLGEDIELIANLRNRSMVLIDPGQVEQVIMNLAVNARDAMPNGGKLSIETMMVDLDEAYAHMHLGAAPGRYAMLAISDSGIGMDQETQTRIFEPFFTTKDPGKGTGLGLATVYGIVKQAGGFVWVYSELGHGATFKIYLPLARDDAAGASGSSFGKVDPRGSETILIAEDAPAVRAAMRQILERHGYTVIDAPSGRIALAAASKHPGSIDLLITDVVMPEMGGRELAEQFALVRPNAKVLYVSGYTNDAVTWQQGFAVGSAFIQKPFAPDALARKIRDLLDSADT
jgi:PAS domain S-box-containing protein